MHEDTHKGIQKPIQTTSPHLAMPIAKSINPSPSASVISENDAISLSQAEPSQSSKGAIVQSPVDFEEEDARSPLRVYRLQQLEHQRRKRRVQTAPDSLRGFIEWLRVICTDIVGNERFQFFILLCICINSIMFGAVTFPAIKDNPQLSSLFETLDMVFLVIFTLDIAMQLVSVGTRYFSDGWNLFDLLVVLISWMSISLTGLYAFRVFRAFRLITRVEMMRNVVVVLFHVVPALSGICIMLLVIMYIYAVLCTDLFKEYYPGVSSGDYFGRIDYSFFTLFQFICMDEWSSIAYEIM